MKIIREVEFDLSVDDVVDIFDRSDILCALHEHDPDFDETQGINTLIRDIEPLWRRLDIGGVLEIIATAAWKGPGISLPPLQVKL